MTTERSAAGSKNTLLSFEKQMIAERCLRGNGRQYCKVHNQWKRGNSPDSEDLFFGCSFNTIITLDMTKQINNRRAIITIVFSLEVAFQMWFISYSCQV